MYAPRPWDNRLHFVTPKNIVYEKLDDNRLEKAVHFILKISPYVLDTFPKKAYSQNEANLLELILKKSYEYTYIAYNKKTQNIVSIYTGNCFNLLVNNIVSEAPLEHLPKKYAGRAYLENSFVKKDVNLAIRKSCFYIYEFHTSSAYQNTDTPLELGLLFGRNIVEKQFKNIFIITSKELVRSILVNTHRFKQVGQYKNHDNSYLTSYHKKRANF